MSRFLSALGALTVLAAQPAGARELAFTAELRGDREPTVTGSQATGQARIVVDTDARTVSLMLDVQGMRIGDLWTQLVRAPVGPIHLHRYGSHDHSDPSTATLAFAAPFGAAYQSTQTGFRVSLRNIPYAAAAALVQSEADFDAFVASLQHGAVVLNVHTNARNDGEISGPVGPATN